MTIDDFLKGMILILAIILSVVLKDFLSIFIMAVLIGICYWGGFKDGYDEGEHEQIKGHLTNEEFRSKIKNAIKEVEGNEN